ncbi:acyl-CoA thioesterase [Actinoalloteichus spitiensis]|uniref:acyl-CoA thioesterase n=1 Tax=Actinoalloteichus spitiensis TaxID=252394 RepID=UPI00036058C8|nr:thioesterase family protein [Actinoalloteichus spitiensis]
MAAYVTDIAPRWSDMDSFGHVNNAKMVTLLEEARVGLLFDHPAGSGLDALSRGVVIAHLAIDYHLPVVVTGAPLRVEIAVREVRTSSFTLDYALRRGPAVSDPVAASAQTVLVPFDVDAGRPRRLSPVEAEYLSKWVPGPEGPRYEPRRPRGAGAAAGGSGVGGA